MKDTVRFTMDMSAGQHKYLKMLAAKEGASMKEYIMNHLPSPKNNRDLSDEDFRSHLKSIVENYGDELKKLADR